MSSHDRSVCLHGVARKVKVRLAPPGSATLWFGVRYGQVAQLAEHAAENRGVGSSILPLATQFMISRLRSSAQRVRTP